MRTCFCNDHNTVQFSGLIYIYTHIYTYIHIYTHYMFVYLSVCLCIYIYIYYIFMKLNLEICFVVHKLLNFPLGINIVLVLYCIVNICLIEKKAK